jgi:hypothetical protein
LCHDTHGHAAISIVFLLWFFWVCAQSHMVVLFLVFLGVFILISIVAELIYVNTNCVQDSFSPASLWAFVVCFLDDCHSDWREIEYRCSFDLYFPNDYNIEHFNVFIDHLHCFFLRTVQFIAQLFIGLLVLCRLILWVLFML